jgi:hypothetical protein
MVTKSLLPLKDGEDGGEGATNVHTAERESARGWVAWRRVRGGGLWHGGLLHYA